MTTLFKVMGTTAVTWNNFSSNFRKYSERLRLL